MEKDKLFVEPFGEGTLIKLELYRDYLTKWVPVFNSPKDPLTNTINIFDFFAGVGCDINGEYGSPMIAVDVVMKSKYINRRDLQIHLHLNDYDAEKLEKLKENIAKMDYNPDLLKIHYYNQDAVVLFGQLESKMKNAANLIFFDQYGVKCVDKALFQRVIQKPMTDFLFFVSSTTYNRFYDDTNITNIIEIDPQIIKDSPSSHIHNIVANAYKKFIPPHITYYLAPFSIRKDKGKSKNIYGLIFGSRHPLGMEKFLKVSWDKDRLNGTANFDIEGTQLKRSQMDLFTGKTTPTKIEIFESSLEEHILNGSLTSDQEIVAYMLNRGFIKEHVISVIKSLVKRKKIKFEGSLCFSAKMLYKKPGKKNYKPPTIIQLL